jgi:hypothetical protein
MADQYVDAAGEERFDTAIALTLQRWPSSHSLSLEQVAAQAVLEVFCVCVTQGEDEIEHHPSPIHDGLIAEVVRRAQIKMKLNRSGQAL